MHHHETTQKKLQLFSRQYLVYNILKIKRKIKNKRKRKSQRKTTKKWKTTPTNNFLTNSTTKLPNL